MLINNAVINPATYLNNHSVEKHATVWFAIH